MSTATLDIMTDIHRVWVSSDKHAFQSQLFDFKIFCTSFFKDLPLTDGVQSAVLTVL